VVQDVVHGLADPRRRLDAVEALSRVPEAVWVIGVEEVLLGVDPKAEEIMDNLAPEHERLHHVGVLARVAVGETSAVATAENGKRVCGADRLLAAAETLLQPLQHGVAAVTVLQQIRVVVRDGEDARAHGRLVDLRVLVGAREESHRVLLLLDVALDLGAAAALRLDVARRKHHALVAQHAKRASGLQLAVHSLQRTVTVRAQTDTKTLDPESARGSHAQCSALKKNSRMAMLLSILTCRGGIP
jgi:hypothetical protein